MRVWKAESRQTVFSYQKVQNFIGNIAWSSDSTRIAFLAAKDTPAIAYQLQAYTLTGQHLYTSPDSLVVFGDANSHSLAWSPDGTRITVTSSNDGRDISICDLTSNTISFPHRSATGSASFIAWSPDGKMIASIYNTGAGGTDKTVEVWNAENKQTRLTYAAHSDQVNAVAWSPDSRLIASASADETVQVWLAPQGVNQ